LELDAREIPWRAFARLRVRAECEYPKLSDLQLPHQEKVKSNSECLFERGNFRRRIKKTPTTIKPHQKKRVKNLNNNPEYKNIPKQKGVK
jgi:hypothetical protein